MSLIIGLSSDDKSVENRIIIRFRKFFLNKSYKLDVVNENRYGKNIYEGNLHQNLLFNAYNRNKNLNKFDEDLHLILGTNTILEDYKEVKTKSDRLFIKQINKHYVNHDLFLILISNQNNFDIDIYDKKLNVIIINYESVDDCFHNIVTTMFNELPKCNWCGRLFKPSLEHRKYCSKEHSKYGLEEQNRINNRKYYNKFKEVLNERKKGALGSKNANLKSHSRNLDIENPDFEKEHQTIRNAMISLGLK